MADDKVSIIHNPNLSNKEKEQILGLVETFKNTTSLISYDNLLKAILFSLVYYLVSSDLVSAFIIKYIHKYIDKLIIQSLLFGLIFYIISCQI